MMGEKDFRDIQFTVEILNGTGFANDIQSLSEEGVITVDMMGLALGKMSEYLRKHYMIPDELIFSDSFKFHIHLSEEKSEHVGKRCFIISKDGEEKHYQVSYPTVHKT